MYFMCASFCNMLVTSYIRQWGKYYALVFQSYVIMFLEYDIYIDAQAVMKLFDRLRGLVLLRMKL